MIAEATVHYTITCFLINFTEVKKKERRQYMLMYCLRGLSEFVTDTLMVEHTGALSFKTYSNDITQE